MLQIRFGVHVIERFGIGNEAPATSHFKRLLA